MASAAAALDVHKGEGDVNTCLPSQSRVGLCLSPHLVHFSIAGPVFLCPAGVTLVRAYTKDSCFTNNKGIHFLGWRANYH